VLAVVVVPLLVSEALPPPAAGTRAFFVHPASVPLPPPPPPPAAPAAAPRSAAARPRVPPTPAPATFTAPVEVPEPPVHDAAEPGAGGEGAPGGETAGVQGGIPGGVAGGVLGGVPEPEAPPAIVRVGGGIREPKKIRHVDPVYPDVAVAAHVRGTVVLECVVSTLGRVTDVSLVRGIPLLNEAAVVAVKQWMYTPTLKDGVPVRVLLTVTVRFDL
jgi:protein TonB